MRTEVFARRVALSCCALIIALCTACGGGGGDSGSSGNSGNSGGSASTTPPVSANSGIGAAGGTVTEASGAKVVIPASALTSSVAIAVTQTSAGAPPLPAGVTSFGPIYAFTPHGTTFAVPATITVPFDPASVPAGTTLALLKTNATQSAWDVVNGATVNGNTMVGDVTGFSFATVAQISPTQKDWHVELFDADGNLRPIIPTKPEDVPPCSGCVVRFFDIVGSPSFGLPPDTLTYAIFSNASGRTFFTDAVAPHGTPDIGVRSTLTQTFYFKVEEVHPTLHFIVTKATVEALDNGGNSAESPQMCPWLPENHTAQQVKELCNSHMTRAEASIDFEARSIGGSALFFRIGGAVEVTGLRQDWRPLATGTLAENRLWTSTSFDFDDKISDGSEFLGLLKDPKTVDVPISSLRKGDTFRVEVKVRTTAINLIQGESHVGALLRDPLQEAGIDLQTTGLTEIPPVDGTPASPPQLTCAGGPDPAAGTLQFAHSTFSVPELAGNAAIVVERTGGTTGEVSVHIDTHDATATAGTDYETVSTEVRFADGEGGQRRVDVPLVIDDVAEDDETLNLTLSNVGGCAQLSATPSATLTIFDDDRPLPPPETHTVGGSVSGLIGSGLVLKNVLTGSTVAATSGSFTLPDRLSAGAAYDIRVDTQPSNPSQQCTVTNGTGTITGSNVTNVQVSCASLGPSALDPSFGSGGRVITNIQFTTNVFEPRMGIALQGDGRILLVGGLTLARFNGDGTLDSTFGTGGQVRVPFDSSGFDGAEDVAVQADGKIVVVGVVSSNIGVGKDDFALARFNADGTLDTTFGTGGKTITDFSGSTDQARRVKIQPDGKILVTGFMTLVVSSTVASDEFALARYNSNGTLDTTFALTGKVRDSAGRNFSKARGVAIQSDGRIVVAGLTADDGVAAPTHVGLVRYWGDTHPGSAQTGQRDDTFGDLGNGTIDSDLHLATSSQADDVAIAADGTVIVAGTVEVGAAVGGRDRGFVLGTFDGNGRQKGGALITKFSNQSDVASSLLMQSDGKIVVVGQSANLSTNPDMALARYDSSGLALDGSFGTDGKLTVDFFGGRDSAQAVVQQPDGKLIVGGFAQNGNGIFFALARLTP